MLRRRFLAGLLASLSFGITGPRKARAQQWSGYEFRHGVASGDPLDDGMVLWTRVSGTRSGPLRVGWAIARDPEMLRVVQRGEVWTSEDRDYTVKAYVHRLKPGTRYYYRFNVYGALSPVGRTRTLPDGHVERARFAVVSCSNFAYGYFHAYREIASTDDLDAVLHLGDYLYEYGMGEYATEHAERLDRVPNPTHELLSLSDYRLRHAQYKSDPDSQAMHAAHPLIAVWDDHEIANDAWHGGAQNHQDDDGDFGARVEAAVKAYFEWMPLRGWGNGAATRIFRSFDYGDLLSLTMLDTRLYGRDRQPERPDEEDGGRHLLGPYQERWLRHTLDKSTATWQLIGQQVLVAPLRSPDLEPLIDRTRPSPLSDEFLDHSIAMSKHNPPLLLDTWDGYPVARQRFLRMLADVSGTPVIVSGDLHTSMANNLAPDSSDRPVAVEFMTTSVTSPGFAEYLPEREPGAVRNAAMALNPWVKYMETDRRGWLCLTLDHEECLGEWHLLDTVHETNYAASVDRRLAVRAGAVGDGLQARSE
ncbi:MAG: alkaline phosphatase D family protein [Woeseiaceae bacterium]|nr:alkaline phosphatase D family protein [Woeseiaceae bacterium]